jgi:hypothetical protein
MSKSSIWEHLRNACLAFTCGVVIGVPLGNALVGNAVQQRFRAEAACTAIITSLSFGAIYGRKRCTASKLPRNTDKNLAEANQTALLALPMDSAAEEERQNFTAARVAYFFALYNKPIAVNRAQRRMMVAEPKSRKGISDWGKTNQMVLMPIKQESETQPNDARALNQKDDRRRKPDGFGVKTKASSCKQNRKGKN